MKKTKLSELLQKVETEPVPDDNSIILLRDEMSKTLKMHGGNVAWNGICSANSGCSGNNECTGNCDCCDNGCCNSACSS